MRTSKPTFELSLEDLKTVTGGDGVMGQTGSIQFGVGANHGASVSWPGALDGVQGTWTASSKTGLSWRPA
jgi:hypothetical protein